MPTENRSAAEHIKIILQLQLLRKQIDQLQEQALRYECDLLRELIQLAAPRGHDSVPEG